MRLIHTTRLEMEEFFDSELPKYAILSHCWANDEVTYQDFTSGANRGGDGWQKIIRCCQIAHDQQLEWAWVDTCCIDKTSTAELSEAINSMYIWYKEAEVCYVLLLDYCSATEYPKALVDIEGLEAEAARQADQASRGQHLQRPRLGPHGMPRTEPMASSDILGSAQLKDNLQNIPLYIASGEQSDPSTLNWTEEPYSIAKDYMEPSDSMKKPNFEEMGQTGPISATITELLAESRWFTRGWTLQELLAPRRLYFYDYTGFQFGSKQMLAQRLSVVTGIGVEYLLGQVDISKASVSCRMSWASRRETARKEDIAYCLLGIFNINMPLLYGERMGAFQRLQENIIGKNADQTIFAWKATEQDDSFSTSSFLAVSPADFSDGACFVPIRLLVSPCRTTSIGIQFFLLRPHFANIWLAPISRIKLPIACRDLRWANRKRDWHGRGCVEIELQRVGKVGTILVFERTRTGRIYRSIETYTWRTAAAFVSTRMDTANSSVYVRTSSSSGPLDSGVSLQTGKYGWLLAITAVGVIVWSYTYSSIDREVVRAGAAFALLHRLQSAKIAFLLSLIVVTFVSPLTAMLVWASAAGLFLVVWTILVLAGKSLM